MSAPQLGQRTASAAPDVRSRRLPETGSAAGWDRGFGAIMGVPHRGGTSVDLGTDAPGARGEGLAGARNGGHGGSSGEVWRSKGEYRCVYARRSASMPRLLSAVLAGTAVLLLTGSAHAGTEEVEGLGFRVRVPGGFHAASSQDGSRSSERVFERPAP